MNSTFFRSLPGNIFSGFVVSLIALPLSLGLAIASGVPPIAGVLASITGGIVVSFFGGSHLTITGAGNGLVLVILSAVTILGEGNLYEGYLYTLAAIICSGVLLFVFGVFRLGGLSNFFPSSVLQGMLAAIGIGIFTKQFFPMIGVIDVKGSIVDLILHIPSSILNIFSYRTFDELFPIIIGVISLVIMMVHPKIRNKYVKLIPAPMWIVVFAVALNYYYQGVLGVPFMKEDLLIKLPKNIFTELPRPNFGKIASSEFILIVFSITFVVSIETLLSIKAVDKLDPLKRRSNISKDLKAIGLANIISGFIGGLNVVTVIARSSVNVNNRGSNRAANFFHAFFLLLFIILFQKQISRIALPALAAILVFTGYKLAAPKNIIKSFKIGKEQGIIFLITLVFTLYTNLILGVFFGILATFLIHVIINKNLFLFTRNVLKPNVLMYEEEATGNYYISVKNFCSFLNINKLKNKLNQIPLEKHVIIDFSLCRFVDHTVMEELSDYNENIKRQGGSLEIIGLDFYVAQTGHPFALRKMPPVTKLGQKENPYLTKRQKDLDKLSTHLSWDYLPEGSSNLVKELDTFLYFKTKIINYKYNQIKSKNNTISFFDLSYSEGVFIAKDDQKTSFLLLYLKKKIPVFALDKEELFSNIYKLAGYKDINIKKYPDFSKHFFLRGEKRREIISFFQNEVVFFFESHPYYYVESNGDTLLIKQKNRLASAQEIKRMIAFGKELQSLLSKN